MGTLSHIDPNREIRAMILTALPYPPIPVVAHRFLENRLADKVEITTHDILSKLLEEKGIRGDTRESAERMERQKEVLRLFLADLVKDGLVPPPKLYEIYCKFSRLHIGCYYPPNQMPEILFPPWDVVCRGDATHARMCDYMAGQARLLELQGGYCAQDWMHREYIDLLTEARQRLIQEGREERVIKQEQEEAALCEEIC